MPELPEVQTVVNTLRPRLVGQFMGKVLLHRRDILVPQETDLAAELQGRTLCSIQRRGKRIVFTLDNDCQFYVHLGMTGQLAVVPADSARPPHTHLEIEIENRNKAAFPAGNQQAGKPRGDTIRRAPSPWVLRFIDPRRFGGVWWLGCNGDASAGMGPEPLTLRPRQLAARLAGTTRAIKVALLDQALVAGLGNIYVDESLFASRIHPLISADALTTEQVATLNRAIKTTLRRAIRHRGSTLRDYRDADGEAGGFQHLHAVYGREGEPCRVCKTPIQRIVLGGRSTHFCPKCQKR